MRWDWSKSLAAFGAAFCSPVLVHHIAAKEWIWAAILLALTLANIFIAGLVSDVQQESQAEGGSSG